jgi:hypothetical protein
VLEQSRLGLTQRGYFSSAIAHSIFNACIISIGMVLPESLRFSIA